MVTYEFAVEGLRTVCCMMTGLMSCMLQASTKSISSKSEQVCIFVVRMLLSYHTMVFLPLLRFVSTQREFVRSYEPVQIRTGIVES